MNARYIRKTVILAAVESVIGTDAVPTGAANALQVFDVSITPLEMKPVQLDYITGYFGSSQSLPGTRYTKFSFSVSLAGAGDAATAPAYGALLLGCGSAETTGLTAPARTEYLPATDALKTLTFYWYDDGLLHKAFACVGSCKLSAKAGETGKLMFDFLGIYDPATVATNATGVLTAWKKPVSIVKANVTDVKLGCTYAAGALSGGTAYNSLGVELDWGVKTNFDPFLTTEETGISERKISGSLSLKLTAAEEAAKLAEVDAGATQGMGFIIGTTTGNKIMLYAPALRWKTHKKGAVNGKRTSDFTFELDPVAGNDELRIVSL